MTKKTILIISAISIFFLVGGSVLAISQFQNSQKVSQNNSQSSSQISISNFSQNLASNSNVSSLNSINSVSSLSNNSSSSNSQTLSQISTFSNNSRNIANSNSQIQPLVADATHDVVVLEECDLAIRFSKKYPRDYNNIENFIVKKFAERSYSIINIIPETGKPPEVNGNGFVVKCSPKNSQNFIEYQKLFTNSYFDKDIISKLNKVNSQNLVNLFTKKSKKVIINSQMDENYTPGFIFLETKDKFYTIIGNKDQNLARLDNIQFNSLAPSMPSVKLELQNS